MKKQNWVESVCVCVWVRDGHELRRKQKSFKLLPLSAAVLIKSLSVLRHHFERDYFICFYQFSVCRVRILPQTVKYFPMESTAMISASTNAAQSYIDDDQFSNLSTIAFHVGTHRQHTIRQNRSFEKIPFGAATAADANWWINNKINSTHIWTEPFVYFEIRKHLVRHTDNGDLWSPNNFYTFVCHWSDDTASLDPICRLAWTSRIIFI